MEVLCRRTAFSSGLWFLCRYILNRPLLRLVRQGELHVCDSCLPTVAGEAVHPDGKHPSTSCLALGPSLGKKTGSEGSKWSWDSLLGD